MAIRITGTRSEKGQNRELAAQREATAGVPATGTANNVDRNSFLNESAFDRTNKAGLHYTSIENTLKRLGHNGGIIDTMTGARITFQDLHYDRKTDTVTGKVKIENWFFANKLEAGVRASTPPDRTLVFNIEHKLILEIPQHRSKHHPNKTRLNGAEVAEVLQEFANGLNVGVGERPEEYQDSPIRSGQRIQRLVMPDLDNMRGLGLCTRLEKPLCYEDKKEANYIKMSQEFVANANRSIEEGEKRNPKEAGWRIRLVNDGQLNDFVKNIPQHRGKPTSNLPVLDDIGLPVHKSRFHRTYANRINYGEGMSKEAIAYYNSIADAKFYIQCFYGIKFEKYKLQGQKLGIKTELDKNGYEVIKGTAGTTAPVYIKEQKVGFFRKCADSVLGFFFAGYGRSFCRFIEFQKDEDINRFQIDAGKQVSGLSRIFTFKRNINYWNSAGLTEGNRAFFELLIGAHQEDKMSDCFNKYLDLSQKFATEHLKADKKNLWMTSPFLRSVIAICNGNKPKKTNTGYQEPSIIILNIHFAKFQDVQYYNANFFNANIHGCKFRNSIINGGFTGANFNYCDIGDPIYTRFLRKEWLRACHAPEWFVAWFGNKTLLGFGSEADGGSSEGAERVVFRGSKVRRGTIFEGAIKSGEMRFSAFSFSRFSADIFEMEQFGISIPPIFGPMKYLRFYGFRYKEEVSGLDPRLKGIGGELLFLQPITEWSGRARQYSAKNHVDNLKADMNRVYADGTPVEEDERLLWVEAMQWVPNGIGGRVHRLLMVGADPTQGSKSQNYGFVEILADDDSMKHHYLYGHYSQASSRIIDKSFSEKPEYRGANRDNNQTFFRQFIRNRNRLGSPATRQRKGNPAASVYLPPENLPPRPNLDTTYATSA